MKVLFVISSSDTAFWLSEVTHPYWHLTERNVEVDFASPSGGKVVFDPYSDPYFEKSLEPDDLVSKGFLSDKKAVAKLETTLKLKDVDLSPYDAIHVAGGKALHLTCFLTRMSRGPLSTSGLEVKSLGPSAMARSHWVTSPGEFEAVK